MKRPYLLAIAGLITVLVAAYFLVLKPKIDSSPDAQAAAIRAAEAYKPGPDVSCTQVLTPVIHTASGAHYTFPTGCIAPGWEATP